MKYKNKNNGTIISVDSILTSPDWILLEETKKEVKKALESEEKQPKATKGTDK